jgi:hypothetical protein
LEKVEKPASAPETFDEEDLKWDWLYNWQRKLIEKTPNNRGLFVFVSKVASIKTVDSILCYVKKYYL